MLILFLYLMQEVIFNILVMYRFGILDLLIFCNFIARSQNNFNDFLTLDTIISVPEVNLKNLDGLKFSISGENLYFTCFSGKSNDEIELYSIDFMSGKHFVFKGVFKLSDKIEKKFKQSKIKKKSKNGQIN